MLLWTDRAVQFCFYGCVIFTFLVGSLHGQKEWRWKFLMPLAGCFFFGLVSESITDPLSATISVLFVGNWVLPALGFLIAAQPSTKKILIELGVLANALSLLVWQYWSRKDGWILLAVAVTFWLCAPAMHEAGRKRPEPQENPESPTTSTN